MPLFRASAPGKMILFGEHAVVYGHPAIAAPVEQVSALVTVSPDLRSGPGEVRIDSPAIRLETALERLAADNPLALAIAGVCEALEVERLPACRIRVDSTIPVAGGLGSGAAVSVALIRALSGFLGHPLPNEQVNALAYRVEQRLHGTPSGIDNTVITYRKAIYFQREQAVQFLSIHKALTFVIADSGVHAPTGAAVGDVRRAWMADPVRYDALFGDVATLARRARPALENGDFQTIGACMNENQLLLEQIGVSSPELERLAAAARAAGALGAKLAGAGRGGNIIALVQESIAAPVADALRQAGAARTIITRLGQHHAEASTQ